MSISAGTLSALGARHRLGLPVRATLGALALGACSGSIDARPGPGDEARGAPRGPGVATMPAPAPGGASGGNPGTVPEPVSSPPGAGLLGCPTVAAPDYQGAITGTGAGTAPAGEPLSPGFRTLCAGCHGAQGEGRPGYPPLPGMLDERAYLAVVRAGRPERGMPAFAASFASDAELLRDFRALRARRPGDGGPAISARGEATWSDEQVESAYRAGLAIWRKPDAHGEACADCHGPDAIDLAVIAYPDSEILRRGHLHLPADDVARIVDFVHAQRRRFGITRPCSLDWAPFQPGGRVLPGDTPAAQDLAFWDELRRRDLKIVTGRLEDAASALAAFDEFARLDLRTLPIGIALPKWTHDPFRGHDQKSWSDWVTPVAFTADRAALDAASDRYLADPTSARYFELERAAVGYLGGTHAGLYNEWFRNASRAKRRSVLLASHFFRMELLGRPGWLDRPEVPFPELTVTYNPFALIGGMTQEYSCSPGGGSFGGGTCPQFFERVKRDQRTKFGAPTEAEINPRLEDITHSWWTLATLLDQPMLGSEDNAIDGSYFYWQNRFPQEAVHLPFLLAHIPAARVRYHEQFRDTPRFPRANWHDFKTHPVVSTFNFGMRAGGARRGGPLIFDREPSPDQASFEAGVRIRINILRAFAFKQLQILEQGAAVEIKEAMIDWYLGAEVNGTRYGGAAGFLRKLADWLRDPDVARRFPDLVRDQGYLLHDARQLVDRMARAIQAAPETP